MSTVFTSSQQVQFPDCIHPLNSRNLHLSPRHRLEHIAPLAPSFTSHDRDRNPYYAHIDTTYQQLLHGQRHNPQRYQRIPLIKNENSESEGGRRGDSLVRRVVFSAGLDFSQPVKKPYKASGAKLPTPLWSRH